MLKEYTEPVTLGLPVSNDAPADMATDERPRRIAGRYVVDRLIARGGMAVVYLAEHADLRRPVALKVLSAPADDDHPVQFEERFRLEAQTLAALDHPNIVTLHDFGQLDDGRYFLAMAYIEGPRLTDLVKNGPLPPERAIRLILQVCSALRYAHRQGVVHRDLKPSNLLIRQLEDGGEQVKVVDFGLVKLTDADQNTTRAGLVLGSPHCMSPEQVRGQDVGPASDIYSTGVLLFRIITGHYPFHGTNSTATMLAHVNTPAPTFFSVAPDLAVPPGLEEVVRTCLQKDPAARYRTMDDLITDLAALLDLPSGAWRTGSFASSVIDTRTQPSATLVAAAPEAEHTYPGEPPRTSLLIAAALLGLAGLGLAAGALAMKTNAPPEVLPVAAKPVVPTPLAAPAPTPEVSAPAPTPAPADPTPPAIENPVRTPLIVAKPAKPKPTPRVIPKATPAPSAKPAPKPTPKPTTPDGYKALPDDW